MPSSTDRVATYRRRSWPDSGSKTRQDANYPTRSDQNYQINSMNWGNFSGLARRPLQNQSCPFKRGPPERWPSGLRRTLGKRVCGKPYRGFESHSLRQLPKERSFSDRILWQLGPLAVAVSNLISGLSNGRTSPLFSERSISLRASGLPRFDTVLEIRTFRVTYGPQGKGGSAISLEWARASGRSNADIVGNNPSTLTHCLAS
jgi:hypothetical protein